MFNLKSNSSVFLLLPFVFLLNKYLAESLYMLGVDFVIFLQSHSTPTLDAFFISATTIFDPALVIGGALCVVFFMKRRITGYGLHVFLDLNFYIGTMLKCFMAKPRPYWTNS